MAPALGRSLTRTRDRPADIAERYGWVNRTLADDDLDSFVDTLVNRLTSFDRETLAAAKAQINRFGTPTAAELKSSNDLFFPLLALPSAQAMVVTLLSLASGVQSRNCIPAITAESRAIKGGGRTDLN